MDMPRNSDSVVVNNEDDAKFSSDVCGKRGEMTRALLGSVVGNRIKRAYYKILVYSNLLSRANRHLKPRENGNLRYSASCLPTLESVKHTGFWNDLILLLPLLDKTD